MRGHAIRAARTFTVKISLLLAVLGLAVPSATAAAAQPARAGHAVPTLGVDWRSVTIALSGPIAGASEQINLTGTLHVTVVTRTGADGGGTAQVISSLGNTRGVGAVTGATYRFVGADVDRVTVPPNPITPLLVLPTFLQINPVLPPNPVVPPNPIAPVRVLVSLTATGGIAGIDASLIGPGGGDGGTDGGTDLGTDGGTDGPVESA
ncbi:MULTISPECIES: hypothetical protein [Streptomyces]|uniref:hypothetical protein n=1 Tax=Streptomyces TaxID=1883 RepID=UPI00158758D2|nr:hypothetical protein [Streptomyces sp. CAI-85]NUV58843.1 hypothetical protein [Streptomyces sp. CAI-85]